MIRNFKPSDYEIVASWWKAVGETPIPQKHMPEETTFISEYEGVPVISVCYFATNVDIALVQNFISNPSISKEIRKKHSDAMSEYMEKHCKENGYNILLGMTNKEKLSNRYKELGWNSVPMYFVAKEI